jgi:hypothetical protein
MSTANSKLAMILLSKVDHGKIVFSIGKTRAKNQRKMLPKPPPIKTNNIVFSPIWQSIVQINVA